MSTENPEHRPVAYRSVRQDEGLLNKAQRILDPIQAHQHPGKPQAILRLLGKPGDQEAVPLLGIRHSPGEHVVEREARDHAGVVWIEFLRLEEHRARQREVVVGSRHARPTTMIMGEVCTRACTFCNIATGKPPESLDAFEPGRVAAAVKKLGLNHVVITSVDRDDVEDGGAEHFAQTIRAVRRQSPDTTIEILTPDFIRCAPDALETVVAAKPDVFNHNLETVPGLYPEVRPGARYFHSLRLLQRVKELDPAMFTKSGIMVGLGEDRQSVLQVMDDMRAADIDFLTIGQYLQPTPKHHRVDRFVTPDEFSGYEKAAYGKGFLMVSATPLTRSSYHAGDDFAQLRSARLKKLAKR